MIKLLRFLWPKSLKQAKAELEIELLKSERRSWMRRLEFQIRGDGHKGYLELLAAGVSPSVASIKAEEITERQLEEYRRCGLLDYERDKADKTLVEIMSC